MVTGGSTGGNNLMSTEVLVAGSSSSRQVGDLPTVPIMGLRGISFNNNIIMTGNEYLVQFIQFQFLYAQVEMINMMTATIITTTL